MGNHSFGAWFSPVAFPGPCGSRHGSCPVYLPVGAVLSLWAVFASLCICVPGTLVAGGILIMEGSGLTAAAVIAAGFVCAGLAILFFLISRWTSRGTVKLALITARRMKKRFTRKEEGA